VSVTCASCTSRFVLTVLPASEFGQYWSVSYCVVYGLPEEAQTDWLRLIGLW